MRPVKYHLVEVKCGYLADSGPILYAGWNDTKRGYCVYQKM